MQSIRQRARDATEAPGEIGLPPVGSEAAFHALIAQSQSPTLVLFDAAWCAPGKRIARQLIDRSSAGDTRLLIAQVDVDELPGVASRYEVTAVPALILFRSGQVAARRLGESEALDLESWLEQQL